MSGRIDLLRNPFDPRERTTLPITWTEPPTLEALVGEYLPAGTPEGTDLVLILDGRVIPREAWATTRMPVGGQVMLTARLHGDDGILGLVLNLGLSLVAPGIGNAIAWGLVDSLVLDIASFAVVSAVSTFAVGLIGGALINSLVGPQKPSLPERQSYDSSPAYSWNPATTQQAGGVIPMAFGRQKVYGNVIASYVENIGETGREQVAHVLVELGHGPWSMLSDVKINGQSVALYDSVQITARMGYLDQDPLPGFEDTKSSYSFGALVEHASPVVRSTTGADFDALDIVLAFPNGLAYSNDQGGLSTVSVDVSVEVSADGVTWRHVATQVTAVQVAESVGYWAAGYWAQFWDDFGGTTSFVVLAYGTATRADHVEGAAYAPYGLPYVWHWIETGTRYSTVDALRDYLTISAAQVQPVRRTIRATGLTRGIDYQVKVTRRTDDHTTNRYASALYLASIEQIQYDDYEYPRSVLVAVRALATDQLSGGLSFECLADCQLLRVWNGTAWSVEFSRNPAWVAFHILTQPVFDSLAVVRYDGYDPSRLILADFYAWAQWCDEMVPDGAGGTEPRCCFDGIFDAATTMWEAALEVAASARAVLLMRGTSITVVWDRARTVPAQLFTVGNTTANTFREVWMPMADRAQAIEAEYRNAAADWRRDKLVIVDPNVTEAAGQRLTLANRGWTRPSQVQREANVMLARNRLLRRSGEIGADIDAIACTVGDLVWVQADVTRWGLAGGRIVAGTTTALTLDQTVTLAPATTYEVRLHFAADDAIETRTITTAAGDVDEIEVSPAFSATPEAYDVYAIGETGAAVKEMIVTDVVADGDQRRKIGLLEYNASIYDLDEGEPATPTPDARAAAVFPSASVLRITEEMTLAPDDSIRVGLAVWFDLDPGDGCSGVRVRLRREDGSIQELMVESAPARFDGLLTGTPYAIEVAPKNLLGQLAAPASRLTTTHTVIGELADPEAVTGYAVNVVGDLAYHAWTPNTDVDLAYYQIRFSPATSGATWSGAAPLIPRLGRDASSATTPAAVGTWLIKAFDRGGRESLEATLAVSTIAAVSGLNVVDTIAEAPSFAGTHDGTADAGGELVLASSDMMGDWTALDDVPALSYGTHGLIDAGIYTFADAVDLGAKYTSRLTAEIEVVGNRLFNTLATWGTLSGVVTLSGTDASAWDVALEVRSTDDDPGGSPTWSEWRPFVVGDYAARAFKFRALLSSTDPAVTPEVSTLTVHVDMPDRVIGETNLACGSGGITVTYAAAFLATPALGIAARDMATGDRYAITNADAEGFDIRFYTSGGSGVARAFDYVAKGHGHLIT